MENYWELYYAGTGRVPNNYPIQCYLYRFGNWGPDSMHLPHKLNHWQNPIQNFDAVVLKPGCVFPWLVMERGYGEGSPAKEPFAVSFYSEKDSYLDFWCDLRCSPSIFAVHWQDGKEETIRHSSVCRSQCRTQYRNTHRLLRYCDLILLINLKLFHEWYNCIVVVCMLLLTLYI